MIRRIELINFMSHTRTVIEPADGLTVLVGPNNCGKSAVVAALQILCHNDTSTYVMRHGERECSVTIETSDGHNVQWSRRNGSPRYAIDGQPFDRLDRNSIPDGLHKVLCLPKVTADGSREFDVHFGEQKSPVFLLDKPGSHAAQFFASSSDAASLVEMQKLHQQRMSDARKERIRLDADTKRLARDIAILTEADSIGDSIQEAEVQHAAIEHLSAGVVQLTCDLRLVRNASSTLEQRDAEAAALLLVYPPPNLEATEPLSRLVGELAQAVTDQNWQARLAGALERVHPAPVLADTLPLSSLTDDLCTAEQARELLDAEWNAMQPLQDPPQMAGAGLLEALVREIVVTSQRIAGLQERAAILNVLAAVPELTSEAELASDLDRLRHGRSSLDRAEATCGQFDRLNPPTELADTAEIAQLVATLKQGQASIGTHEQQVSRIADELQHSDSALRQWAEDHRVCPTCGGALDPARVAEHARMQGGGPHV